jgi:hypothetical protein
LQNRGVEVAMRVRACIVALGLSIALGTTAAAADPHVADTATLDAALAANARTDAANRDAVLNVLDRRDVQNAAAAMGLDIVTAEHAVQQMTGDDLAALAQSARAADADLAGGASTVTISLTTLLLLLILIVLIAK